MLADMTTQSTLIAPVSSLMNLQLMKHTSTPRN